MVEVDGDRSNRLAGRSRPGQAGTGPQAESRPLGPIIIGFLVGGLVVLTLGFWIARTGPGGLEDGRTVPAIGLLAPADGDVVSGRIRIEFATDAVLRYGRNGWSAGRVHIHALLNGNELMPGARDIERTDTGRYTWWLPALPPDTYELYLFWADALHRPLDEGASERIIVELVRDQ